MKIKHVIIVNITVKSNGQQERSRLVDTYIGRVLVLQLIINVFSDFVIMRFVGVFCFLSIVL